MQRQTHCAYFYTAVIMPSPLSIKYLVFIIVIGLCPQVILSQTTDTVSTSLPGVEVRSLERRQRYLDAPLSIGLLSSDEFNRHHPQSIVGAMNTVPGVKMEERSPGSYRINIRGSSLRAPFGVRNVKVYLNGLPVTDPGGQTYLNAFAPSLFRFVEIMRGPVSSVYGPGTSGTILIESASSSDSAGIELKTHAGSYGLKAATLRTKLGSSNKHTVLVVDGLTSDGYRKQSVSRRSNFAAFGNYQLGKRWMLKPTVVYSELAYGTPGALNISEYTLNPRSARPPSGNFPGAEAASAGIRQQTLLGGFQAQALISRHWQNRTSVYYMRTRLQNPTIRNYETSRAPRGGGRSVFVFKRSHWEWTGGTEWQLGEGKLKVFTNKGGTADSLTAASNNYSSHSLWFTQLAFSRREFTLEASAGITRISYRFQVKPPSAAGSFRKNINPVIAPRMAVSRHFYGDKIDLTAFASLSRGFSPPSTAEVFPSGGSVNTVLQSEWGWNRELGVKALMLKSFFIDVTAFVFQLKNAIVQRRTASGSDYFVNAGKTRQKGLELLAGYSRPASNKVDISIRGSYTLHSFHYADFIQLTNSFSGNRFPGTPRHAASFTGEISRKQTSVHLTYYYNSRTALNDGNTEWTPSFHLLGLGINQGIHLSRRMFFQLWGGIDNLLDQQYTLGPDINAFGGRYYNASPGRNYFVSLQTSLNFGLSKN